MADFLSTLFISVLTLSFLIWLLFKEAFKYWKKRGVPYLQPKIPLGNGNALFLQGFSVGLLSKTFYDELKRRNLKLGGVFLATQPYLVVVDPEYVKDVLIRDFSHFVDRGFYYHKKRILTAHLFSVDGAEWRNLRTKVTPTFTSGKMKLMFDQILDCSRNMNEFLATKYTPDDDVDVKDVLGCCTTDVIGTCAFGVNCNSFRDPDAEFRAMGRKVFEFSWLRKLNAFFIVNFPELSKKLQLNLALKVYENFFLKIVRESVSHRDENNIRRNDFLQLLMDLRKDPQYNLSLDQITAQVFLFFLAGFETSSTAMTFALYELAKNQTIQERLRDEICNKYQGVINYETIKEMKYLDHVFLESLRMYPPLPTLNRRCTQDYTFKGTNITIEKGTPVLIPVAGIHMDPEFFPEPELFNPDRYETNDKASMHLAFGDGPRNCIGLRFGAMQSKTCIANIVKNFALKPSPNCEKIHLNPIRFLLESSNTVYVKFEKLRVQATSNAELSRI